MSTKKNKDKEGKLIAENRRARFDFEILEQLEAGLVLHGSEVKALRNSHANIAESYASFEKDGFWLINSYIPEYSQANIFNHEPRRLRKMLLSKKEIRNLLKGVQREGMTVVPLRLYFNKKGLVKLQIALARGKKLFDKRQTEKKRDWGREKQRLLKSHT